MGVPDYSSCGTMTKDEHTMRLLFTTLKVAQF